MTFSKAKALEQAATLVRQKKLPQAIQQYETIVSEDPSDLSVLNALGDLLVWNGKLSEGLRHFHKLAEAYEREGSRLKAIAIYKKIAKLDPSSPHPLLQLGKIYAKQGSNHKAKEQYNQALTLCLAGSLTAEAAEAFHGLMALDPEDLSIRIRAAEYYEEAAKSEEAYEAYLGAAELALGQDNAAGAEQALQKASALDPQNPRHVVFRILLARQRDQFSEIEAYLSESPQMAERREIKEALAKAYLEAGKPEEAAARAARLFRDGPASFGFIAGFCAQCVSLGYSETAAKMVGALADVTRETDKPDSLTRLLSEILAAFPEPAAGLEWLLKGLASSATSDESGETLERLGNLYAEAHEWESAEKVCEKLAPNSAACQRLSMRIAKDKETALTVRRGRALAEEVRPGSNPVTEVASTRAIFLPPAGSHAPGVLRPVATAVEIDFFDEWAAFVLSLSPSGGGLPVAALEIDFFDEWKAFTSSVAPSEARSHIPAVEALEVDFAEAWNAFTSGDLP